MLQEDKENCLKRMKSSEIEPYGNLQLLERAPKTNGEQMDYLVKTIGITGLLYFKKYKVSSLL